MRQGIDLEDAYVIHHPGFLSRPDMRIIEAYPGFFSREYGRNLRTVDPMFDLGSNLVNYPDMAKVFIGAELLPGVNKVGKHKIIRFNDARRKRMIITVPQNLHMDVLYHNMKITYLEDYIDLI